MHTTLTVFTEPTEEPVSLVEAKLHLRVSISADDDLISSLITAARQVCEAETRRAFVTRTYDYFLDYFPANGLAPPYSANFVPFVRLPAPPLVSITFIKYYDTGNVLQTWSSGEYTVQTGTPGRVQATQFNWPFSYPRIGAVQIRYVAGYGAATAVPAAIKAAIKLLVGHWYENRESVTIGQIPTQVPETVYRLLSALKWGGYP